jgi:hypothetical protein
VRSFADDAGELDLRDPADAAAVERALAALDLAAPNPGQ